MKTLAELADAPNVEAIAPKVIVKQVEVAGRPNRVMAQLLKENRDLIAQSGRVLRIPTRGQITAETDISIGSGPTTDAFEAYSTTNIEVQKSGVLVRIAQEEIDGTQFDIINDHINEGGEALAQAQDAYVENKFTEDGAAGTTIAESSYDDLYGAVVAARTAVITDHFNPNVLVIHPDQEGTLLKDNRFIDASRYGDRDPILNGEIGRLAGLNVLVTAELDSGEALVVDTERAGYLPLKRPVELKREEAPDVDSVNLWFYEEYGAGIVNNDAVAIITGAD